MTHRLSTSTSTNIKNLAIALEAFSRFPTGESHSKAIADLLEKEIQTMQEEQYPVIHKINAPQTEDDDIPF